MSKIRVQPVVNILKILRFHIIVLIVRMLNPVYIFHGQHISSGTCLISRLKGHTWRMVLGWTLAIACTKHHDTIVLSVRERYRRLQETVMWAGVSSPWRGHLSPVRG